MPKPTPTPPASPFLAAAGLLAAADPRLARVIERVGPCRLVPDASGTHFSHLARAIVYQQLSSRAAATIHGRFLELFGGAPPTAAALLATPPERIRATGVSRQKASYLEDLARRTASGEVAIERLHELADDDVIEAVTRVKGVGRWTAHMLLIFRLGRPDVLADTDLAIRKAVAAVYRMRKLPTPERVAAVARRWRPHRTVACWYLWRSLDVDVWGGPDRGAGAAPRQS